MPLMGELEAGVIEFETLRDTRHAERPDPVSEAVSRAGPARRGAPSRIFRT